MAIGNPRLGGLLAEIERGRARADADADEAKRTIADMRIGDTAYTLPWAMRWAEDGGHCLRPDYPADTAARGTTQMRVMRTANGFCVWSSADVDSRLIERRTDALPVVKLMRGDAAAT